MASSLANIMPKILARALLTLRERCVMPRLVNGDYSTQAAQRGDVINVPIPTAVGIRTVTPSNTPPAPTDATPAVVQINLDYWKQNDPIYLTDKELVQIDMNAHYLPMQMGEAVRALANEINRTILIEYKGVYGFVGTAGTTPFASTVLAATDARKILNAQLAPRTDRRGVLNHDAEANALALAQFSDAEKIMSSQVKMEGELGRKYGIDWVAEDQVQTHTSTPLTAGACTVNGAHAVNSGSTDGGRTGTISINKLTNASPLVAGDILTFAGDPQTYVVRTDVTLAVGNTTVSIAPALRVAKSGAEAVTLKATHVVNLAFHRDAFALAMRPLASETMDLGLGNQIMTMQDPQTGLILRLEFSRQYKQVVWEFDALWGAKLVRPELAVRIAG